MSKNMQMKKETGKISHRKFLSENIGLLLIAPAFLPAKEDSKPRSVS